MLSFTTRNVDGAVILDFRDGGCHPANDTEIEMLQRIAELEATLRLCVEAICSENGMQLGEAAYFAAQALNAKT